MKDLEVMQVNMTAVKLLRLDQQQLLVLKKRESLNTDLSFWYDFILRRGPDSIRTCGLHSTHFMVSWTNNLRPCCGCLWFIRNKLRLSLVDTVVSTGGILQAYRPPAQITVKNLQIISVKFLIILFQAKNALHFKWFAIGAFDISKNYIYIYILQW